MQSHEAIHRAISGKTVDFAKRPIAPKWKSPEEPCFLTPKSEGK